MWDKIAGFFGGGASANTTPPIVDDLGGDWGGTDPFGPNGSMAGPNGTGYNPMQKMMQGAQGAAANIPQKQMLQPGRLQQVQPVSGLLDFYSREQGQFAPPQSPSGLLTMPRYTMGV